MPTQCKKTFYQNSRKDRMIRLIELRQNAGKIKNNIKSWTKFLFKDTINHPATVTENESISKFTYFLPTKVYIHVCVSVCLKNSLNFVCNDEKNSRKVVTRKKVNR